jgi:hypothetical protein
MRVQSTRFASHRSPPTRRPSGSPTSWKGKLAVASALVVALAQASCVPLKPLHMQASADEPVRGGSAFFVASSNCGSPEGMGQILEPWFKKWRPSASLAATESEADVVIDWYQDPCEICVDCDELPVPNKANAILRFKTGQRATWEARRPLACATRDCLPPMLARAVVTAWERQ